MMTQTWTGAPPLSPCAALAMDVTVDGDGVAVAAKVEVDIGDAVGRCVGVDCGGSAAVGRGDGVGVSVNDQAVVGGGIGVGVGSGGWPYPIAGGKIGVTSPLAPVSTVTTCSTTVMLNLSDALSPSELVAV